ncbi:hypothetical protein JCM5353_003916 [Sporobolomyces roseus]
MDAEKNPIPLQGEHEGMEDSAVLKKAVRKMDLVVLPLAAIIYLLNFLDAKVAGLATDPHLTSQQYLTCVTATYILYIVWELPSKLLLKRVGAHIMIPGMVVTWGTVSCLTGLVSNFGGLFAAHFFLGLCEGGLFPELILYLSMFYRRRELQTRISAFFASASLSGAFSGLLAAAIVNLDGKGGQEGWRWVFYLEGLFTVLFGLALFFSLPRDPQGCKFLTQEERNMIDRRLAADVPPGTAISQGDRFSWREVKIACTSPQVILVVIAFSGGIASTWLFPQTAAPEYETACKTLIAMTILVGVFSGLNILYLRHANHAKAHRREEKEEANYLVEGDQHPAFLYNY